MRSGFDRRVVPEQALDLVRACQRRVTCRLAGGAVLSGVHLRHRLSGDLDLFFDRPEAVRELLRQLPNAAAEARVPVQVVRDSGTLVRARVELPNRGLELDLVHETAAPIEPAPPPVEGVAVESLADLRASKLTCILSRSEPRDLIDLLFLDRAGHPPERDVALALRKDAGIDPGVFAWLLAQFPTRPLPVMLQPLTEGELASFRDELRERFRRLAVPPL